jgi:hypothetical protein
MPTWSDGIVPGLDLGTRELVIKPEWIEKYAASIDVRNPWYSGDSNDSQDTPFGGPIAPAAVFNYEMELVGGWHPPNIQGRILNTDQTWEFHRPMRPGQRVVLKGRVEDRYEKRGREYIAMEATAWDDEGRVLCRTVTTHAWPVQPPGPSPGEESDA